MSNTLTYQGHSYNDNEIVSGTSAKTQSLNMRELSVDSASFTLRPILHLGFFTSEPLPFFTRDNKRFYTSEANPLAGGVVQNAPIKQYIDGSQVAVWLAKSIDRVDRDRYRLSCVSPLGLLMQKTHYGGIYNGSKTVSDVVAELMGDAAYFISPEFENIALYGWLPIAPARDNLMQVLFAVNAALTTDADGTLRIGNLSTTPSAVVGAGDIYASGATVEYQAPVTQVVLLEHNFVAGSETRKLFDGVTSDRQLIPFGQPMTNLQATGFTILDSDANYAVLSAGSGVLTGTPYIDTTREIVRPVAEADVPNEVRIEKATLVGTTASSDVADRLQEYYKHRSLIKVAVADKLPRGSIQIYDPYDGNVVGACVEASELAISAVEKTSISALVGFTPWQTIPFTDEHIILDTAWVAQHGNTYTFPADIQPDTNVQIIIIGGGQAGTNGGSGSSGGGSYKSGTIHPGETVNSPAGSGGSGGAAGAKGIGGNIWQGQLSVDPKDAFSFTVGAGGASNGALGVNSTFGTLSSVNGSTGGYFDPVTQTQYGADGVDGVAGANGGNGGSASGTNGSAGSAGGNVETYNGGSGGAGWGHRGLYSDMTEALGGGGGGGAAHGANGSGGGNASSTAGSNRGGNGGAGAAAALAAHCGDGGSGGNGGGGGGGGGAWAYHHDSTSPASAYSYAAAGGSGGAGSVGSAGADGCVILIFRKPAQNNE